LPPINDDKTENTRSLIVDKDFIKRHLEVSLEYCEKENIPRDKWPQFLTDDLCNNWEMVEQAKDVSLPGCPCGYNQQSITELMDEVINKHFPTVTRGTPEWYDRNE
jgi:hypothetical protein